MTKSSRYCCVVNCGSRDCGTNKRTIFQVPTDSNRREKWLEVLSQHLKEGKRSCKKLYVCDLHFRPEDILRNTVIVYTDGSMEEIPRQTVRLKLSSVPSVFNNAWQQEKFSEHNYGTSQSQLFMELYTDISGLHMSTYEDNSTLQDSLDSTEQNKEKLQVAVFTENKERILQGQVSVEKNQETFEAEVSAESDQETKTEIPMLQECQNTRYSLYALTVDAADYNVQQNMPHWTFAEMSVGILFSFVGDDFPNTTRSIFIKEDMTVEIRAKGCIVQQHFLNRVDCFQDLLCIIAAINEHNLCEGVDNGAPCPSGFVKRDDKRSSTRCDDCRSEQRRIKDRELKAAKRAITKKVSTQKLLKNLKRKYQRLQNTYIAVKEEMENLKLRCCAEASERNIIESIKNFPAPQQEAVKTYLAAAQCNGPTGNANANVNKECVDDFIKQKGMMFEIQCRACLVITDFESSYHVEEIQLLGKTLKEIILLFVPQMDTPSLIGDVICFNCYNILQSFSKFIEGCIEVESILNKVKEGFSDDCNKKCTSVDNKIIKSNSRGLQSQRTICNNTQKEMVIQLNQTKIMNDTVESENKREQVSFPNLLNTSNTKTKTENCSTERKERNEVFTADTFDYDTIDLTNNDSKTADSDTETADSELPRSDGEAVYFIRLVGTGTSIDEVQPDSHHFMLCKKFDGCNYCKCSLCNEMIDKVKFSQHMMEHNCFVCEQCGDSFAKFHDLKMHEPKHKKKEGHLCPICGKLFTIRSNLGHHMKTHEENRERIYMCDKCPKSFMAEGRLNMHIRIVHEKKNQVECPKCKKKCSTKIALTSHDRLKHSDNYSHTCHICQARFVRGDYFRRHMSSHSVSSNPNKHHRHIKYTKTAKDPVTCKYCLKVYKNIYLLRMHLLSHVKFMRYRCRYCSLTFSNAGNKNRHQRLHKNPNFDLRCKFCWKQMETKEELEEHVAKHDMSRKYDCKTCGELFASKYWLRHHISEKHTTMEDVEEEKAKVLQDALEEFLI